MKFYKIIKAEGSEFLEFGVYYLNTLELEVTLTYGDYSIIKLYKNKKILRYSKISKEMRNATASINKVINPEKISLPPEILKLSIPEYLFKKISEKLIKSGQLHEKFHHI